MKSEKISSKELFNAIDQIYQEKGITSEYLIDSLKSALKIAYKRDFINTYSADEREERKNSREDELVKPEGSEEKKVTKNGYLIPQDIDIDITDQAIKVYCVKEVVENVDEKEKGVKISLEDAKQISKKVKVGDLISRYGHIGIIIGIENNNYYVAEALDYDLHVKTFTEEELIKSDWLYIQLMDEYYKKDGNLTTMW